MVSTIILSIFGIFFAVWLIGFIVFAYHVFAYGLPGDATKKTFYVLLGISLVSIITVVFFMSGVNWRVL